MFTYIFAFYKKIVWFLVHLMAALYMLSYFIHIVQINNAFETNDAISAQLTPVSMVENISI